VPRRVRELPDRDRAAEVVELRFVALMWRLPASCRRGWTDRTRPGDVLRTVIVELTVDDPCAARLPSGSGKRLEPA